MNLRRLFQSILVLSVLACTGIFVVQPILAATGPVDQTAFASFAANAGFAAGPSVTVIIARLIRTVISFLGVIAVVIVVYGGFMYMTAGGNDERVKKAKKTITNGLIGLVIVLMSFAIAQFIVSRLVGATEEADIIAFCKNNPTDPTCLKNPPFPPPKPEFTLSSLNTDCAKALRNFQLQFVFSKSVKNATGISVKQAGVAVPGVFQFAGPKVTFTPDALCEDNPTFHCFQSGKTYEVVIDNTKLTSASGATLTCTAQKPCCSALQPCSFTAGSAIDTQAPTMVMKEPAPKVILGVNKMLQAATKDDSGVSFVDFFVENGNDPIFTAGLDLSTNKVLTGGNVENSFNTDPDEAWNTSGLITNKSYTLFAKGNDCAGNFVTSNKVSVMVYAPNCDNDQPDAAAPYNETGKNCGGDPTSQYYCGKCIPSACTSNAECASGFCIKGFCQDVPVIQSVSPDNGASENLVTISGSGFGTTPGFVDFLGTEKAGVLKTASAYQCGLKCVGGANSGKTCSVGADCPGGACNPNISWSEKEIVIQVPVGAVDGPIKINIPATGTVPAQTDRSDDAVGPVMSKFDVNAIKRPGLCALNPVASEVNKPFSLAGLAFGGTQGTSSIYLANFEAKSTAWTSTQLTATVPGVVSGTYNAQVFTGDYFCLNASGAKVDPAKTCFSDDDCKKTDASYTCGMSWCSESLKLCSATAPCAQIKTAKICNVDADCDVVNDEFCDKKAKVCVKTDGVCTDVRAGSNAKTFVATNIPTASKPTINSIDTGWKACSGGVNNAKQCAKDADCGGAVGSCKSQPTWGPAGQYVTIYGSDFGTATGYVKFVHIASSESANGEVDFPKVCGGLFWRNDSITVKVPKTINTKAILFGDYQVSVVPQSGNASDAKAFTIVTGKPTPGICLLNPNAGPVGTVVNILGENFGETKGIATFNTGLSVVPGSWIGTDIGSVSVPTGAKSGPLFVTDALSNQSNSINFTVGNCQQTPSLCASGQTCCANGSCSLPNQACPSDGPKVAHFAYKVSTSQIPVAPTVVINCSDPAFPKPSPSPSPLWSKQENICVSAAVTASFGPIGVSIDPTTLNGTNIKIQKCPPAKEAQGTCAAADWQDVPGSFQPLNAQAAVTTFQWSPAQLFETSTLYQVTIKGASAPGGGVKSKPIGQVPGASLAQDFSWTFRTSTSNAPCGVGAVTVSPKTFTAKNLGESVSYQAQLLSNQDHCVVLACAKHSIGWSSSQWAATFLPNNTLVANPAAGVCTTAVNPRYNTLPGIPAEISATVTNAPNKPTGKGELTIALANPRVSDYFPNCSSACGNVEPWVTFSVPMNDASLSSTNAIRIYQCENSLCDENQQTLWDHVTSISYDEATNKAMVKTDGTAFVQNTWYRVRVSGKVKSSVQALLSTDGSNFGTPENKFYLGDFSWRFKTKDSGTACVVDRVGVSPKSATLKFIGERKEYTATAYSAPDDCSVTGQALQAKGWNGWGAKDTPNKIGAASYVDGVGVTDHKYNEITAFLLNNGSLELTTTLPKICAGNCLFTGNPIKVGQAVCGNSVTELGESCDDGNSNGNDGCSSVCLKEGTAVPLCGNTVLDPGEQCDDGKVLDGDGCSAKCLNEGAGSIKSICGDGVKDHTNTNGGEACDDGNTKNGDGCSSNCLFEGGIVAYSNARCGDGVVGTGETCDDGKTVGGDGCSDVCLNEGTNPGFDATKNHCGNGVKNIGEDEGCDLALGKIASGCSKECLKMGSSPTYTNPSFCGNGGALEAGEQCEAVPTAPKTVGPYAVAEVSIGAPIEVESDVTKATYGYAISNVQVSIGGKTGTGEFKLLCSCDADAQCGSTTVNGKTVSLGCGASKCCFVRPSITASAPGNDAKDVCRNTAVSFTFSEEMDPKSFGSVDLDADGKISAAETDPNLQLELVKMKSVAGADVTVTAANCPYYTQPVGLEHAKNLFASIWNWVKDLFGQEALANATTQCFVPISYEQVPGQAGSYQVYLRYTERLLPFAQYKLTVKTKNGNAKGVFSKQQVSICLGDNGTTCQTVSQTNTFTTGADICLLDVVQTTDEGITSTLPVYLSKSPGYYSKKDEAHNFSAKPLSYRKNTGLLEEITSIDTVYSWTWSWGTPVKDSGAKTDILGIVAASTEKTAQFKALGKNGSGDVIATANVNGYNNFPSAVVSGHVAEVAFLCENPWPALDAKKANGSLYGIPFIENAENTNFSLFYCRDIGKPEEGKMLPALELPPTDATPDQKFINTNVLKELVFRVAGTKDSIGVRVLANPTYLSPAAWFKAQGFTGTPKAAKLDGYEAVQTGTTIYAAAANRNGSNLYANIYVVSFNADAGKEAQEIFDLVLQNFRLNANDTVDSGVSHVGLCKSGNGYVSQDNEFIACSWDGDCLDQCQPNGRCTISDKVCDPKKGNAECNAPDANAFCDADKQKLRRDTKRLTDITDMVATFEKYGNANGRCAVTKSQKCVVNQNGPATAPQNPACPGTETCVPSYPTVQAGTFIPSMSNSVWPSWNSTLGNAVGGALPTDPLNQFWAQCKNAGEGYDSATCWNSTQGKFVCPERSHLYAYQNQGGEAYTLSTELEYNTVAWSNKIDQPGPDHATIQASYRVGKAPGGLLSGFKIASEYCSATVFGSSTICGDGVKAQTILNTDGSIKQKGEVCEKGEVSAESCVTDVCTAGDKTKIGKVCNAAIDCGVGGVCTKNVPGKINTSCKADCFGFQSKDQAMDAGAECLPGLCGNGVKDPLEACDDGALNGTYGHCGSGCKVSTAFTCGDGFLAGNEQCDCGTPTNFGTLPATSWAKSSGKCDVANGTYSATGKNCTAECKAPGPMCGDKVVNDGSEKCDGNTESYAGALNTDGTKCTAGVCPSPACTKGTICTAGINIGTVCSSNVGCPTDPQEVCKADVCNANKCSLSGKSCNKNSDCIGKCSVSGKVCTQTSDCAGTCSTGLCANGTNNNTACSQDSTCTGGGKCIGATLYDLARTRTCKNYGNSLTPQSCLWINVTNPVEYGWGECAGGPQQCGNGKPEGTEACDDGNNSNNDACTNACTANVCGDNYVNVGIESCDSGAANGSVCSAAYGATCNFCNKFCQYKTQSGPYCGDGTINGNEYCDGAAVPFQCFKADQDKSEVQGTCDPKDEGNQGTCPSGFTCRLVGACNGGSLFGENGKSCTPYTATSPKGMDNINNCDGYCSNLTKDNKKFTCNHDADCVSSQGPGGTCLAAGSCQVPVCGATCGSSCPTAFQKVVVQVQGNVESQPSSSVTLYSFENPPSGKTPDKANIFLPACRVGTGLTADVVTVSAPQGNFSISASIISPTHKDASGNYIEPQTSTATLGVGSGVSLPFPSGFICRDVPFTIPLTTKYSPDGDSSVTFKNIEFTYCPK